MKINGRDVTLTSEELDLLKSLKDNGAMSIIKSDEDYFLLHDGDFSMQGSMINVRWFKGFDWMQKGETLVVGKLIDESEKPATVWELEDGDVYWVVNTLGEITKCTWYSDYIDTKCRNQGNAFLTKEEAKFESKRREVVAKVRTYARPFIPNEENWTLYWDCKVKIIHKYYVNTTQEARLYFESKEKIEQAIEEVGEEDFKKYYLGVIKDESRKTCKD